MLDEDMTNLLCDQSEYFDRAFFGEHKVIHEYPNYFCSVRLTNIV